MNNQEYLSARIPDATYRLQLTNAFTFADAASIVSYLNNLGISDLYSSPCFTSRSGSTHGYDIVNYNEINPELGGEAGLNRLSEELQRHEMGLLLDIVPNHMCIASDQNHWWMDVLENGPSSQYADYFDIDWKPVKLELKNKILIPTLGDQYGKVLENRHIRLCYADGVFYISCYDRLFPVRPRTYVAILKHRIETLKKAFSEDSYALAELLSIITALEHLPTPLEKSRQKIEERYRETQIIQRRLHQLSSQSSAIRQHIDDSVAAFSGSEGDARSFDLLDRLLRSQVYRLAYWRVAAEEINYRRFFDINDLAAIRMEDPAVYGSSHRLLFRLVRDRVVTGLRVDHADGLYDPVEYLRWLQRDGYVSLMQSHADTLRAGISDQIMDAAHNALPASNQHSEHTMHLVNRYRELLRADPQFKPFYIVCEKILIKGERMPEDWPVFSTTGYVFLNSVNGLFIDMRNEKALNDIYARFTRRTTPLPEIVYENKKLVMQVAMASEIINLSHYLQQMSEKDRHTRDFTLGSLVSAIVEVIAFFPVYRTYINSSVVTERDQKYIDIAVAKAKRRNPAVSASIFDFLRDVLLLHFPETFTEQEKNEWLTFVMRFQQLTGPVMAKGLEDTSFYVYNRFVSLNEVGGAPERFGTPLETFHGQNIERSKFWPHALITTGTHDMKRGEDVRARINVLSEMPDEWRRRLMVWRRLNNRKKMLVNSQRVPDPNEEYLLYQTLLGAWPFGSMGGEEALVFRQRIKDYLLKAAREAKINTSWINPDPLYEDGMNIFIDRILEQSSSNPFLEDFSLFQSKIAHYGVYNSLSQVLLKITSPGVPDFYQGTELWDFSLVDPDNRRPVDFSARTKMLAELMQMEQERLGVDLCGELMKCRTDGRIKLYLIYKALHFRRANGSLFKEGEYLPMDAFGNRASHVCAFARRIGLDVAVIVVPRLLVGMGLRDDALPLGTDIWGDTNLIIPFADPGSAFRNVFTGDSLIIREHGGASSLFISDILNHIPVAVLQRIN